jgi:cell division initiation protein
VLSTAQQARKGGGVVRITPVDIQQAGFSVRFRGYDRQEVDTFLDTLTEDYETLVRDNRAFRDRMADLESQVNELRKKEATLNNTLVKAQSLVEEMHQNAHKEAELITKEAEIRAEDLIKTANQKIAATQSEILDLKKEKVVFLERIRSVIQTFQKVINTVEEQNTDLHGRDPSENSSDEGKRDDNLRVLRPKP